MKLTLTVLNNSTIKFDQSVDEPFAYNIPDEAVEIAAGWEAKGRGATRFTTALR